MIKLVLTLFDGLAWALRRLGVDYPQFRAILETKLTIDTRVRGSAFQRMESRRKSPKNVFVWTLVFNALMGSFIAFMVRATDSPLVAMTIIHSFIMAMVGMALIADFSTVLLDTTDSQILQPRPVSNRTIVVARMAHIITYLTLISVSLAAGSLVVGTLTYGGVFLPVFVATLIASDVLVVGLVAMLYLLLMRFVNEEKLRDLITYVQIAMTVIVVAGFQVVPRMMDMTQIRDVRIDDDRWIYLYPPAWLAGPMDLVLGAHGLPQMVLTGLAVFVPLTVLLVVVWLAPAFRISAGTSAARAQAKDEIGTRRTPKPTIADSLANLFIRRADERAVFGFLWRICTRDRQFKRRTYPGFAFIFVFAAVFIFRDADNIFQTLATLHETKKHLLLLYFAGLMVPTAMLNMRFTEQSEAAWIYGAAPLACPGVVLAAGLKVLILQLLTPAYVLMTLISLAFWGVRAVPDIVLALGSLLIICTLYGLFLGRSLPFARPFGVMEGSGRFTRSMTLFLGPLMFGGLHYALTFTPYGVILAIPFAFGLYYLLSRRYARTTWADLRTG